ncbi:hypothetical protein KIN20_007010 [Parelaphostrongylus tenuis]|uniref:Uncharacterized protein n=1 Tax=Parelaphostrongylus tenuis TaxID=148309 RepID=A0AAD5M5U0_PARTN|nr:hypothetical protein KIN20_007010 [Parelaphostrongylus tenuis]
MDFELRIEIDLPQSYAHHLLRPKRAIHWNLLPTGETINPTCFCSTWNVVIRPYHVNVIASHPDLRQYKAACRQIDKEEVDRTRLGVPGSSAVHF